MSLKNKSINDTYIVGVDTAAACSPIPTIYPNKIYAEVDKDYSYTSVDNIKWHEYEKKTVSVGERLTDLLSTLTGPIVTHEDSVMSNMHTFMGKHEFEVINSKNRELLLKRIPEAEHTIYTLIINKVMEFSQISICKTCGHLEIKKYG